jgi:type I restriction enzyme S subunit
LTEEWRSNNNYTDPWLELKVKNIVTKVEAGKSLKCIETPPQNDEYGIIKISAVTWGIFDENESKTLPNRNLFIEDRRVNALKTLGVEADRIKAVGYGESKPVATNTTAEGKAQNRRVEAVMAK